MILITFFVFHKDKKKIYKLSLDDRNYAYQQGAERIANSLGDGFGDGNQLTPIPPPSSLDPVNPFPPPPPSPVSCSKGDCHSCYKQSFGTGRLAEAGCIIVDHMCGRACSDACDC